MFFLPVGHEKNTVRRLPWVTFAIMGLCLLAHVLFSGSEREQVQRILETRGELGRFFYSNPQIDLSPEAERLLFGHLDAEGRKAMVARIRMAAGTGPAGRGLNEPGRRAQLNREMNRRVAAVHAAQRATTLRRWGLIPVAPTLTGIIGHMFLHGSWLHLLANLLMLYLAGPFIEDVWGRAVYASFYVVSGLAAAALYCLLHPGSHVPLVGASGAIAGVMGAFLVRCTHTQIDFVYLVPFAGHGRFTSPAWVMLPMWFVEQMVMTWTVGRQPGGGGVAYSAHVGGFVFGAGAALFLRYHRVEERWLRPAIDRRVDQDVLHTGGLDDALALRATGDREGALDHLVDEARRHPGNRHLTETLWMVACEEKQPLLAAPALLNLMQLDLRAGRSDEALGAWRRLVDVVPDPDAKPALLISMGRLLARRGEHADAAAALRLALLDRRGLLTPALALAIARSAANLEPGLSRAAARWVKSRPEATVIARAGADAILADPSTSQPPG